MSKELLEKRSKLMADRKALSDLASKENRPFTAAEKDQLVTMKTEFDAINFTIGESEDQAISAKSMEAASRAAMGRQSKAQEDVPEADRNKYRLSRLFEHLIDGKSADNLDGVEGDVHRHMVKELGGSKRGGVMIPTWLFRPKQAIVTTTTGAGGVATVTTNDYIDALRNRTLLGPLGLTILGGLQGKLAIPKSSGFTAYWPGENTNVTISSNTITAVTFTDKLVGAYQDVTRSMINQTTLDMDMYLRDGLLNTLGAAVSDAALAGTGGTNTILGVLNNTNTGMVTASTGVITTTGAVTLLTTATGTALTWALAVKPVTAVVQANAAGRNGAYVTTPAGFGNMTTTAKASNAALFCADANGPGVGEMYGNPVLTSGGIAGTGTNGTYDVVYGLWSDAVLGLWGTPEVIVDPYALSLSGGRRLIALQSVDMQLRQPQSFCRMYGMTP